MNVLKETRKDLGALDPAVLSHLNPRVKKNNNSASVAHAKYTGFVLSSENRKF